MARRFSVAFCASAAAISLLMGARTSAQDLENRCTEIGSQCTCSETLNFYADLRNNPNGPSLNPPNSVTKQCGDQCSIFGCGDYLYMSTNYQTASSMVRASDYAPFPSGANPWIYRGGIAGVHHYGADHWQNVSNETVCQREYRAYDANVPIALNPDGSQRLKLSSIFIDEGDGIPGRVDTQFHEFGGKNGHWSFLATTYALAGQDYWYGSGGWTDMHTKCHQGWCRLEHCVDLNGNTIRARSRITYLADGTSATNLSAIGTGPSTATLEGNVGLFGQNMPSSSHQFLSHYMQSRVPYNPNFWIGPAYELEGPVPPPPLPSAPPPPVLLP